MTDIQTSSLAPSVPVPTQEQPVKEQVQEQEQARTGDGSPGVASSGAPAAAEVAGAATPARARQRKRGGRGRRGATPPTATVTEGSRTRRAAEGGGPEAGKRPSRGHHPLLSALAERYPRLFGEQPLPLKRGIFEDLAAAHADWLAEDLKVALGLHTRSTRYLSAVAAGQPRHDLSGQAVEAMAPEHVHHALLEVFKRRQQRSDEDLRPKLRRRLARAFEASGLAREDYALKMRHRDDTYNQLLDEALAEAAEDAARDEALLRAFEAAGVQDVAAFASLYGRDPRQVRHAIDSARERRQRTAAALAPRA